MYRGSVTQQLGLSSRGVLDGTSSERPELGTDGAGGCGWLCHRVLWRARAQAELVCMVETCVVAGMTLAKAENRDTVLGGVADSDGCYLELVQPGGCIVCVC